MAENKKATGNSQRATEFIRPEFSQYSFGYPVREPYEEELTWFKENPTITGRAASDGTIILNPYSGLPIEGLYGVIMNEASRLWMQQHGVVPHFDLTPEQIKSFEGTEYGKPGNEDFMKQTLIGRIISNDPSAGKYTPEQKQFADVLLGVMSGQIKPFDPEGAGYDYESAVMAGQAPSPIDQHWSSRVGQGVNEGLLLKGRNHPTFYKTLEGEKAAGYDVYNSPATGRYYSRAIRGRGF